MPAFYHAQFPGAEQDFQLVSLVFPGRTEFVEVSYVANNLARKIVAISCHSDDTQTNVFTFPDNEPSNDERIDEKHERFILQLSPKTHVKNLAHEQDHAIELDPRSLGAARLMIRHHFMMSPDRPHGSR